MPSATDISAQILVAVSLGLSNTQMVQICDLMIAGFLAGQGAQSYAIGARQISFFNIQQAQLVREYYTNAPAPGDRPYINQLAEFN
jgi:hypothetical protein